MGDLGKLIVAKGSKKLPKVQYIAQSGHTDHTSRLWNSLIIFLLFTANCLNAFSKSALTPHQQHQQHHNHHQHRH